MQKLAKSIRVATLAPAMALYSLSLLYWKEPAIFGGFLNLLLAVFSLTVLPILAYPLQPIAPHFRGKGRTGQRQLAIVMAVVGYLVGIAGGFLLHVPDDLLILFFTYLISGLLMVLFNKGFKIKASGHTCGVAGPIAFLVYTFGAPALFALPLLALVCWASLRMGRHTWCELLLGGCLSISALLISIPLVTLF